MQIKYEVQLTVTIIKYFLFLLNSVFFYAIRSMDIMFYFDFLRCQECNQFNHPLNGHFAETFIYLFIHLFLTVRTTQKAEVRITQDSKVRIMQNSEVRITQKWGVRIIPIMKCELPFLR